MRSSLGRGFAGCCLSLRPRDLLRVAGACLLLAGTHAGLAQRATVTINVRARGEGKSVAAAPFSHAVVWLTPLEGTPTDTLSRPQGPYRLVQKSKQFTPHLLVVPRGSTVEFPNEDPFFHNVFSLFNGKRFDLGLYEAGSRRSVQFDREGVSYIFCNIHPEMGAVVVSLSTPLYAISGKRGEAVIASVPEGEYRMHVWAEDVPPEALQQATREVHVHGAPLEIGPLLLPTPTHAKVAHKNKFGDDYNTHSADPY